MRIARALVRCAPQPSTSESAGGQIREGDARLQEPGTTPEFYGPPHRAYVNTPRIKRSPSTRAGRHFCSAPAHLAHRRGRLPPRRFRSRQTGALLLTVGPSASRFALARGKRGPSSTRPRFFCHRQRFGRVLECLVASSAATRRSCVSGPPSRQAAPASLPLAATAPHPRMLSRFLRRWRRSCAFPTPHFEGAGHKEENHDRPPKGGEHAGTICRRSGAAPAPRKLRGAGDRRVKTIRPPRTGGRTGGYQQGCCENAASTAVLLRCRSASVSVAANLQHPPSACPKTSSGRFSRTR